MSVVDAAKIKAYARVEATDLEIDDEGGSTLAAGEIEKLGTATLTKIRTWVSHHQVVIQPVLNTQRRDAIDSHDPPLWMRDLVMLRAGHCIFPRCQVDARSCDLDHTIPYDENGPPGRTRASNLACLCRRHHRAKTTGRWQDIRTPAGDHTWHGPYGTTYLVTPRGGHDRRPSSRGATGLDPSRRVSAACADVGRWRRATLLAAQVGEGASSGCG